MTLDQMKQRKKDLGYSNRQISELTGVPLGTVQKIFGGETAYPRYDTLRQLEKLLGDEGSYTGVVREAAPHYGSTGGARKKQGEYTVADWEALPDDVEAELVNGELHYMAEPMIVHQDIITALTVDFANYIRSNHGPCRVYTDHAACRLFEDDKNMVVPDLMVVCRQDKLGPKWLDGAPDLVVEILSPSTRKYDMVDKLERYKTAGVREYWIVDPDNKKVYVYDFEDEKVLYIYSFQDKIPVRIWDGKLIIDFSEIDEYISYQYDKDGKLKT